MTVGQVTFESAAYVARYVMKKITGDRSDEHYVNRATGELRIPEFTTMSRRPGIARGWYDKFKLDLYPSDFVIMRGMRLKPARFYDGLYEKDSPMEMSKVKARRNTRAFLLRADNDFERLDTKEKIKMRRIGLLHRGLEKGEL